MHIEKVIRFENFAMAETDSTDILQLLREVS